MSDEIEATEEIDVIGGLRKQLSELEDEQKKVRRQRDEVGKKIAGLINQAKTLREERNKLTDEVQELKKQREKLNQQISSTAQNIKQTNQEKKKIAEELGIKGEVEGIKRNIKRIEYKIETEALEFDKEQKLMKTLKELKAKYAKAVKSSEAFKKGGELVKQIKDTRKSADSIHKDLQQKAVLSQQKHEVLLDISKQIDELKVQEEAIKKDIKAVQDKIDPLEEALEKELAKIGQTLRKSRPKKQDLEEKKKEIEGRLSKGKKLTTEDLLTLQSIEDEK